MKSCLLNCTMQSQSATSKPSRKDKSLGVLTLRFISLFFNSSQRIVALEAAGRQLVDGDASPDKLKTTIRRLYDIANVLCALNLIEKVKMYEQRCKPAFKWSSCPPFTVCSCSTSEAKPTGANIPSSASRIGEKRQADPACENTVSPRKRLQLVEACLAGPETSGDCQHMIRNC
jgi:hypothetical protein